MLGLFDRFFDGVSNLIYYNQFSVFFSTVFERIYNSNVLFDLLWASLSAFFLAVVIRLIIEII